MNLRVVFLEALLERTHVDFVGPRARILVGEKPECVGDRRRLEQVFILEVGQVLSNDRHVDRAVDVDVADVDALRMQISGHHLRQATDCEFGRPNAAETGLGLTPAVAPVIKIAPLRRSSISETT